MKNENPLLDKIIDKLRAETSKISHKKITTVTISTRAAWDFCKLGRDRLGDLSQELFHKGPAALDGKVLWGGVTIKLDKNHDAPDIVLD